MFESHPNKSLIKHIKEVTKNAKKYIGDVEKDISLSLEIATTTHDFGKFTSHFQKRLYNNNKNPLGDHSYISSLFGAYIGQELLGEDSYLPLIIYSVILHHHGNLNNLDHNLPKSTRDISNLKWDIEKVDQQLDDMNKNFKSIYQELKEIGLNNEFEKFIEDKQYKKILINLKKIKVKIDRGYFDKEKIFYTHQLIYSCLIDGDKISASNTEFNGEYNTSYESLMDIYNSNFNDENELSKLRREIFTSVQENIEKNYNKRIFSITAPTGTGKTLSGFYAAKKLSEFYGDRKIIYALPFTSIIDQNYDVIYDLYNNIENFEENSSRYIIKHHSLSDFEYKDKETEYDLDKSKLLIEGWNSSIIVTTFVQLFESILGFRNKMLKKLHSIKGSIILLDELQSIDIKNWNLIDYLLHKVCEDLDCRVITMTATKPVILEDGIELLEDYKKYFNKLNRVSLYYDNKSVSIEEFADNFISHIENKSYLIVCNTIGQSIDLYNSIKNIDRPVIYLSTNIVPKERKEKIKYIKKNIHLKPIVVSTQVIEAGVDLDFDMVIRDLAPLDSIIQAAGRCNRNNKSKGKVKVVRMVKDDNTLYGKYVYGNMLLNITDGVLKDKEIEESDFLYIIREYFNEAYKKKNTEDIYSKYKQAMERIEFDDIKCFSIIENRPNYIDVFFEIDKNAKELVEKYKEIKDMKDFNKKYKALIKIYPAMRKYMISIPDKYIREFDINNRYNIIRMPIYDKERLYDDDIGFNREDIGDSIFL